MSSGLILIINFHKILLCSTDIIMHIKKNDFILCKIHIIKNIIKRFLLK